MACKFVSAAPVVTNDDDVVRIRFDVGAGEFEEIGLTPHAAVALFQQLRAPQLRQAAARELQMRLVNGSDSF